MSHIDGFVGPVPRSDLDACRRMLRRAAMTDSKTLPFDGKQMFSGGARILVDP